MIILGSEKSAPLIESQVQNLTSLISEKTRQNEELKQQLLVIKHSPQGSAYRRTLPKRHFESPSKARPSKEPSENSKCQNLQRPYVGVRSESDIQELKCIVETLQTELERAQVKHKVLTEQVSSGQSINSPTRSRDGIQGSRLDAKDIKNLQSKIKEADALLMILEHRQQQMANAFQTLREQEPIIVKELSDLKEQLEKCRSSLVDRQKQLQVFGIKATGGGEYSLPGGQAAKELEKVQEELAALQAENRAVRRTAFGGAVVVVQSLAQNEERSALQGRVGRLREELSRQQTAEAAGLEESARLEVDAAVLGQEVPLVRLQRCLHSPDFWLWHDSGAMSRCAAWRIWPSSCSAWPTSSARSWRPVKGRGRQGWRAGGGWGKQPAGSGGSSRRSGGCDVAMRR